MEGRYVEMVFPDEELPSDELHQIKVLDVPVLSKSDRDQIEATIARVNELLASPVGDKINYVLDSLEELKKENESLRASLQTEETNYRLEDVSRHIQAFLNSIEGVSLSLKRMESLPERIDVSMAAEVADEIKDSRTHITEAQNSIDALSKSISNARREISEVRASLTTNEAREEEIVNKIDAATEKISSSVENVSSLMQSILESVDASKGSINSAESRLETAADSFEQGLGILDTSVTALSSMQKGLDLGAQTINDAVAGIDAVAERLAKAEDRIRTSSESLNEFRSSTSEGIAAAIAAVEEKSGDLHNAVDGLRSLSTEISRRGESMDAAVKQTEKFREAINLRLAELESVRGAVESAVASIESYGSSVAPFVTSAEKASTALENAVPQLEHAISRFGTAEKSMQDSAEVVKNAQNSFVEGLSETGKTLESTVTSVDRRTDDILNVMMAKARDFASAIEKITESVRGNEILHEDLEGLIAVSSGYVKNVGKVSDKIETINKNMEGANKNMESTHAAIKKASSAISKAASHIENRDFSEKKLLEEVKKLNSHLAKYDDVETVVRLNEAKRRLSKSMPKWLRTKQNALRKSLLAVEEEMGDVLILTSLRGMKMNMASLKKSTGMKEPHLRKRLKKLVEENRVVKERLGRYIVYGLK